MNRKPVNLVLAMIFGLAVSSAAPCQEVQFQQSEDQGSRQQNVDDLLGMKKISELETNILSVDGESLAEIKSGILSMRDKNNQSPDRPALFSEVVRGKKFSQPLFSDKALYWDASEIVYHPLYFSDIGSERYGQDAGLLQPALSGGHFFGRAVTFPIQAVFKRPFSCEFPLGHFRPGNCNPYLHYTLPW